MNQVLFSALGSNDGMQIRVVKEEENKRSRLDTLDEMELLG